MQPEQGQGPQPPGGGPASPRASQAVSPASGADGAAAASANGAASGSDGAAARAARSAAPSAPGDARPPGPGAPPAAQGAPPAAQDAPTAAQNPTPAAQDAPTAAQDVPLATQDVPLATQDVPLTTQGEPLTGPKMFRLPGAIVAWWAWIIFAGFFLVDIIISGRGHTAAEIAATLVFVTGVVYACALRPRVIADPGGITVQNPLRDHRIPWGSVAAVDLRESVQVHCVKEPGAKRGKVIHSWALYTQRRSRLRSELLKQNDRRRLPRSSFAPDERASAEAQKIMRQPAAQIMATQLDDLAQQARDRGAAAGPRVVSWAWPALAAIVIPGIVLVLVITVFR